MTENTNNPFDSTDSESGFASEAEMLLSAITTGSLSETMRERLEFLIQDNADFRDAYLECIEMDALLKYRERNVESSWDLLDTDANAVKSGTIKTHDSGDHDTNGKQSNSHSANLNQSENQSSGRVGKASLVVGAIVALAAGLLVMFLLKARPIHESGIARSKSPADEELQDPFEFNGWSIRPAKGASFELESGKIKLAKGELFAESINGVAQELTVQTEAGNVSSKHSRFYVAHQVPESSDTEQEVVRGATQAASKSITRLLLMAGTAVLTNSVGESTVYPGKFFSARAGEAPIELQEEGNYREAFDVYRRLIVDATHKGKACRTDIDRSWECLQRLGRLDEWDELIEQVVDTHQEDWEVLYAVALRYWYGPHQGVIIDNQFLRTASGGQPVDASHRDRIRALQLMKQASSFLPEGIDPVVSNYYYSMSEMIRGHRQLWNLQTLTMIDRLPEFGEPVYWSQNSAPPVDENDNPIFYEVPDSWQSAANDGERWRWLLQERVATDPGRKMEERFRFADFLHGQFGVQTSGSIGDPVLVEGKLPKQGRYTTHTLKSNETIARLATGVRRFAMPKGHDFISLYEEIARTPIAESANPLNGLSYRVYHGDWDKLPDFNTLEIVEQGDVPTGLFDLDVANRIDSYGVVFEGKIDVPKDGECFFGLQSDDGIRLWVNDQLVIDYDGCHGMDHRLGKISLQKGTHSIRVEYFQRSGEEGLIMTWHMAGMAQQYLSRQRPSMSYQEQAMEKLAYIYENRRQFSKAADWWKQCIDRFGTGNRKWRRAHYQQIVGNWLRLETAPTFPAGSKAVLAMKFRNGTMAKFKATRVDFEQVIDDSKAFLKSDPGKIASGGGIMQIGNRIVVGGETKYLSEESIEWSRKLNPPADHWTGHVEVETPLDEAGVYLVEATAEEGNTSRVLCWITDTTIVMKKSDDRQMYFVADSVTGEPIPGANIEFFAFHSTHNEQTGRDYTKTSNFSRFTDKNGLVYTDSDDFDHGLFSRIVIARDKESGRFGYLGDYFREKLQPLADNPYRNVKAWCATDRPVYRPGQRVHQKSWVRLAQYELDHVSLYGGQEFTIAVMAPGHKELFRKKVRSDEFGGLSYDWKLDDNAMLGEYHFSVIANDFIQPSDGKVHKQIVLGTGHFRVEEYKKPEYEVTIDAPNASVTLGDKFTATIKASYYFGSPVSNASVKYTVKRTDTADSWFPAHGWDWFYGKGHWYWGYDYRWYPGWDRWCLRPTGWFHSNPPEVVLENTVPIGQDGTVKIEIDSAVAKERFGNTDHRYQITAEVVDESRRTVTGSGSVIATRNPFNVYVWMDGGHFQSGEQMQVNIQARTANSNGVAGKGEATLYRIQFDDAGKPDETIMETWPVETDKDGHATFAIKATQPGQYRLVCNISDAKGQDREGAALTRIVGAKAELANDGFRFNDLELVLDKAEYQPGDRARLLINTAQAGSTVVLFVRPVKGIYTRPEIITLDGKSAIHEIDIARKDMPNIHVEAFTISQGKFFQASKQIVVPPENRMLTLNVTPSDDEYRPGEKAKVKLQLTDSNGEPFVGSTLVAIYDKSLEAIAESSIVDIRSHFWKWNRQHQINSRLSSSYRFHQLLKTGEAAMSEFGTHWVHHWGGRNAVYGLETYRGVRFAGAYDNYYHRKNFSESRKGVLYAETATATLERYKYPALDALAPARESLSALPSQSSEQSGPVVRSRFADTALWVSSVVTDEDGIAEVELEMPENLTTWKIKAWSVGHGTRVGQGEAEVVTNQDVMVRLQAPRFFTESDQVVLSANVHNYTGQKRDFEVSIELPGNNLNLLSESSSSQKISVEADQDGRVNWLVNAVNEGPATIRVKAITSEGKADAMEQTYPVLVHGIMKTDSHSLTIRGNQESKMIQVSVPEKRTVSKSKLEVRYSPSIALSLIDALPFLAENSYKNSESSISRLGPLVTVQKLLTDMGISLEEIQAKQINLNPQEMGDAKERASQWKRHWDSNPIFDRKKLDKLVERSMRDLTSLQNPDGGWGWYAGHRSRAHMTTYVVHGLQVAEQNGAAIVPNVINRGLDWLWNHQESELKKLQNAKGKYRPWKSRASNTDAFVFMELVDAGRTSENMAEFVYRDRLQLSPYCQAMIGLAMDKLGDDEKRDMVVRNLSQFLQQDAENQTAWLGLNNRFRWHWYGNDIETNSYYLKLLCRTGKAKGEVASGLAKYLLNNRKNSTHWGSSRDSCIAIESLAEYAFASGETDPDMTVSILVDGDVKKTVTINKNNLFSFDNVLLMEGDAISAGDHSIEIRRTGKGPLYANAYITNFTKEDRIIRSGLEVKVERRYYKLKENKVVIDASGSRGNVVDYRVGQWTRTPLEDGTPLKSGDLIEVELILESKNDYEYLQFSDRKPAGFEVLEVQSGHRWLGGVSAYMELRDERVDLFVQRLSKGRHSLTYRVRAEVPGKFSALPASCVGVYAPELRANSNEHKLNIE